MVVERRLRRSGEDQTATTVERNFVGGIGHMVNDQSSSRRSDKLQAFAQEMFWVQPRFTRWAMACVPHQPMAKDLSLQQLTVLNLVRTEGIGLAEVARRCMVAPTVITGIADRLERQGLIRRENDPTDRRVNRLVLSEDGEKASIAIERSMAAEIANQLDDFTDAELAELRRGLELIDRVNWRLAGSRSRKTTALSAD